MKKPFLMKFAKNCVSPKRVDIKLDYEYEYDDSVDMVRSTSDPAKPLAIDIAANTGPMTKKADIEKGEDNKDRMMWA